MSFGGFQANTGTGMFGAAKPATSGFGGFGTPATTASGFSFGTPAATSTATGFGTGTPGFGTGLTFGSPQTSTGVQFGAPQTSQPSVQFGAPQPAGTGFQLGGSSFGTPATSAQVGFSGGSLTFGTATTTAAPSFFTSSAPTLGAPATITPAFNFNLGGTSTASTGFSLGAPTTAAAPGGFSFGLSKTTSSLSFGTTTPSLSFGTNTSSAPTLGLNFNLGGSFGASSAAALSTATTTTTVGLGGVDSSQSKTGLSGVGITEPKQVKDHQLPDPILQHFTDFQAFVKQQKSISVDIAHSSAKPLKKVQEDIDTIESLLADLTNGLARNTVATEKLKTETAQGLFNADMAQRLREAPGSLSFENGPEQYFSELIIRFETDAARLKVQVEAAERHLRSITQSSAISPQELSVAVRRLHETLVGLAARVQSLHLTVLDGVEKYRHLRHVYLKEDLPVPSKPAVKRAGQKSLAGPTAFSETAGIANLSVDALSMLTGGVMPLAPATTTPSFFGGQQATVGFMTSPNSSFLTTPQPVENSAFQLSKPPVGNKRNKR